MAVINVLAVPYRIPPYHRALSGPARIIWMGYCDSPTLLPDLATTNYHIFTKLKEILGWATVFLTMRRSSSLWKSGLGTKNAIIWRNNGIIYLVNVIQIYYALFGF